MSDDLKARLRADGRRARENNEFPPCTKTTLQEQAADALDARDAEIARLREALVQIDALDPGENVRYMASAALAGNITNIGHIARAALIRQAEEQGND